MTPYFSIEFGKVTFYIEAQIFKIQKNSCWDENCSKLRIFGFGPSLHYLFETFEIHRRLESKEACRYFVTIINLCHPFALWASWVQSNPILCTLWGSRKNLKRFKSPLFISQNLVWGLVYVWRSLRKNFWMKYCTQNDNSQLKKV